MYSLECSNHEKIKVAVSNSTSVFENLALEDYVYENFLFDDNERMLFIWRNDPCVVIGRHQNPWIEVNFNFLQERGITLCRRNSGGGSVFHDLGNINLTFFTNKNIHDRKENLDFIIKSLKEGYSLSVSRNKKDDILLHKKYKVSGTAAKLGAKNAYHHCTLLCKTDLDTLKETLFNPFTSIMTNATRSVVSNTANLFPHDYNFNEIVQTLCQKYLERYSVPLGETCICHINPLDYPTVSKKAQELNSWSWIYGKTPKFTVKKDLLIKRWNLECVFEVNKGMISKVTLSSDNDEILSKLKTLIGVRFNESDIENQLSVIAIL